MAGSTRPAPCLRPESAAPDALHLSASKSVALRPARPADRSFALRVFFETQRHIIEELFGWRGDDVEQSKFDALYDEGHTSIVELAGEDVGWLTVFRGANSIEINSIYIVPKEQGQGLGTHLMQQLIAEANADGKTLTLSTAKINRARQLYERLGFVDVSESEFKAYMARAPKHGSEPIEIREETPADIRGIRAVNDAAFERSDESRLVERLRGEDFITASIVASVNDSIVGNAIFSRLPVEGLEEPPLLLALAPVAVTPDYQSRGIGSRIIRYGLAICAQRGYAGVLVLGDPEYYTRFGFSSDLATHVRSAFSNAGRHWMALELREFSLSDVTCSVTYPPAFQDLG